MPTDRPQVDAFVRRWQRHHARTRRVAERIPPERLEWAWAPGRFTPGDLLRHLAGLERWMWAETARGRPSRYPGHGRELADGFEAVLAYHRRLHEEAVAVVGELADADLARLCVTPGDRELPVGAWLRAMLEHEAHHRGQLYLLLAQLGVPTPPLFGLTSEELRERSGGPAPGAEGAAAAPDGGE